MKVVILAAGKGSRLGQGDTPKPLTLLNSGHSILKHQLDALSHYISLDQVLIVVGYHQEMIKTAFPTLKYIENPDFATENTSKSLLKALKHCMGHDVLWINGDVVFYPAVLATILKKRINSMLTNVGGVGEEEVKYRVDRDNYITEVSKQVKEASGEALGINYITAGDLGKFCESLNRCELQDYFEKGLEICIREGMKVLSIPVDNKYCTEVDFPSDLEKANNLLASWNKEI